MRKVKFQIILDVCLQRCVIYGYDNYKSTQLITGNCITTYNFYCLIYTAVIMYFYARLLSFNCATFIEFRYNTQTSRRLSPAYRLPHRDKLPAFVDDIGNCIYLWVFKHAMMRTTATGFSSVGRF